MVQDLFLTETAQFADVVMPAATWGEKTGTFTNADRTVHLCEKAVDPPGDARPDLDTFLDYAARTGFKDKDGDSLVHWTGPEEAFEAWNRCSAGCPCDHTGLNHDKLCGPSGFPWPRTDQAPVGADRLYAGGVDWAHPDRCGTYGKDLVTGEPQGEEWCRSATPAPSPSSKEPRLGRPLAAGHRHQSEEACSKPTSPLDRSSADMLRSIIRRAASARPASMWAIASTATTTSRWRM